MIKKVPGARWKTVTAEVPEDTWRAIKLEAVKKDMSVLNLAAEILFDWVQAHEGGE
jgi:hypothetical protein